MRIDKVVKQLVSVVIVGLLAGFTSMSFALEDDELDPHGPRPKAKLKRESKSRKSQESIRRSGPVGMHGYETVPMWAGQFLNVDTNSIWGSPTFWQYQVVGNSPFVPKGNGGEKESDRVTTIDAPIIPLTFILLDYDGSVRLYNGKPLIASTDQFVQEAMDSPIFKPAIFDPTEPAQQYGDAIVRATFPEAARSGWHTLLKAEPKPGLTVRLPRGSYRFSVQNGTISRIIADSATLFSLLYPSGFTIGDTSTIIGAAEALGLMKPTGITSFLMPAVAACDNLALLQGCIDGWHDIDIELGDRANDWKNRVFVHNFSNWFTDNNGVATTHTNSWILGHEMAELLNDPLVSNLGPWWSTPDGAYCSNRLEVADILWKAPAFLVNGAGGKVYNLPNVALLPWFMGDQPFVGSPVSYSFPDRTLLTAPLVPTTYACQ